MAILEIFKQLRAADERLDQIYGSSTLFNKRMGDGGAQNQSLGQSKESSIIFLAGCRTGRLDPVQAESTHFIDLLRTRQLNVCLTNEQYDTNLMFEITADYIMLLVSVNDATYQHFLASMALWKYAVFNAEADFTLFEKKASGLALPGQSLGQTNRVDVSSVTLLFKDVRVDISEDQDLYARI